MSEDKRLHYMITINPDSEYFTEAVKWGESYGEWLAKRIVPSNETLDSIGIEIKLIQNQKDQ